MFGWGWLPVTSANLGCLTACSEYVDMLSMLRIAPGGLSFRAS